MNCFIFQSSIQFTTFSIKLKFVIPLPICIFFNDFKGFVFLIFIYQNETILMIKSNQNQSFFSRMPY